MDRILYTESYYSGLLSYEQSLSSGLYTQLGWDVDTATESADTRVLR